MNSSSVDRATLEEVRRNMEQPEALKYRHNTGNRAYGFEQTLNKQAPKGVPGDPTQSYNVYNYAVAGNYKS